MHKIVDLKAVADRLAGADSLKTLRHKISHGISAVSALEDLEMAQGDFHFARQMTKQAPRSPGNSDVLAARAAAALFNSAVILYARATKSETKHRTAFDVRQNLPEAVREAHDRITAYRDDAFAHFGPGSTEPNRRLVKETLLFHFLPDGRQRISSAIYRADYREALFTDLSEALPASLSVVCEILEQKIDQIEKELSKVRSSPALRTAFRGSQFDPEGFFDDVHSLRRFLSSCADEGDLGRRHTWTPA